MNPNSIATRLHDKLAGIIAETPPGERLPSEPALAERLSVSRATLREAMRTFETQGIIRRKQGAGTFVNYPPHVIESGLEVLESIETMAQRSGLKIDFGALNVECRAATIEESTSLGVPLGEQMLHISRVILAEGRPAAFLVDNLPLDVLTPEDLQDGFNGSVLDLLLKRGGQAPLGSRTEINAVPASSQVARALGIQRGDVLLSFTANLYSPSGRAIDHSYSYFLPGYFRFHVVRKLV